MGDTVWVARPKQVGGHKIQTWWVGPYPIVERKGNSSFAVQWGPNDTLDVHADQLKPWKGESESDDGIPLFFHQDEHKEKLPMKVEKIRGHRLTVNGYEFLTHWQGSPLHLTLGSQPARS